MYHPAPPMMGRRGAGIVAALADEEDADRAEVLVGGCLAPLATALADCASADA